MKLFQPDASLSDCARLREQLSAALHDPQLIRARQRARASFSPGLAYGRHFAPPFPSARQAAVLLLLEPREGQWTIPLTVRPDHLPDHPGQVSLPGGRLEPGESHCAAASREFWEEVGCVLPGDLILGELLPLYVYNSDYYVRSFVAVSPQPFTYQPCAREVARLLHLPVDLLSGVAAPQLREFSRGQVTWNAPCIEVAETRIWGATAIILAELGWLWRYTGHQGSATAERNACPGNTPSTS